MADRARPVARARVPALRAALRARSGDCVARGAASPAMGLRPAPRSSAFAGMRSGRPPRGLSTGSPSTRGCACGSTAARSTSGRRRRASAAPPTRSAAGGRSSSTRVWRRGPLGPRPGPPPRREAPPTPATAAIASGPFTGLGFDACAAPSSRTMSAWASSPYRAIGVYIGGANRACSQPNLTTSWVGAQVAAGWHLIPTYVGLQAPTSSCGSCAKLSSNRATGQGTAQAEDAVEDAQSVGIGPGNPIYFDMEAYTRTSSATQGHPHLPRRLDRAAARARLRLRRLQQQRLRHRRHRRRSRHRLPPSRRPLDGQLERPGGHARPLRAEHRLEQAPADPPVPRRPQRDLRRGDDQHRRRLRRRSDRRRRRFRAATPAAAHRLAGEAGCGDGARQGSLRLGRQAKPAPARSSFAPTSGSRSAHAAAPGP